MALPLQPIVLLRRGASFGRILLYEIRKKCPLQLKLIKNIFKLFNLYIRVNIRKMNLNNGD